VLWRIIHSSVSDRNCSDQRTVKSKPWLRIVCPGSPRLAETDLTEIASYTLHRWGIDQTIRYIDALEVCCQRLVDEPKLGRACEQIRPGLRRVEHGLHVVFYRVEVEGVTICRTLHQRMLPERQNIDDESL
jgi:toxin ParE1/3/4